MINVNPFRTGASRSQERAPINLRGTTLIELLVVIVIFLVGILAVIQVFGKGLQLLGVNKNNEVASQVAQTVAEDVTARPDELPDMIEAVKYSNGLPIVDQNKDPNDLGPTGDSLSQQGILSLGGGAIGNWQMHIGADSYRRVVGEGKKITAPSTLGGAGYASVSLLDFGPYDPNAPIYVYGNSLTRLDQPPSTPPLTPAGAASVTVGANTVTESYQYTPDALVSYEYFVVNPTTSAAFLLVPTSLYNRTYHITLSAYVQSAGGYSRVDYPDLSFYLPAVQNTAATPLVQIPIVDILTNTSGALQNGQSFTSVEYESIDLAPQFVQLSTISWPDNDPYEFSASPAGCLYFNPAGYSYYIERPGGARQPLSARVNYDVLDWRIIHQDFRVDAKQNISGDYYAQFQLQLGNLKVAANSGPDGLPAGNEPFFTSTLGNLPSYDNIALVDAQTGLFIYPNTSNGRQLVSVDKHNGVLSIYGVNSSGAALTGILYGYPPGTSTATLIPIDLTGRSLRVYYMARNEWSIRVLKPAALYSATYLSPPAPGQFYVPPAASLGTKIYFPKCDVNAKVNIDQIFYMSSTSTAPKTLFSQDFVIAYPIVPDGVGLPCIDVSQVDPTATQLTMAYGSVARGVKGASLAVQVLWNPASFNLTSNPAQNLQKLNVWGQSWRKEGSQTYLQPEINQ